MGPDSCAIGPVKPYNVSSNEQEAPKILMNIGRHEVDLTMITQQSPVWLTSSILTYICG